MTTPKVFRVQFSSQYHETEEFLCTSLDGVLAFLHSPERGANPSEPETEREAIMCAIKLAWGPTSEDFAQAREINSLTEREDTLEALRDAVQKGMGVVTHRTGNNKYTAEVSPVTVW